MPINIQTLATELTTDPLALGYAALISPGDGHGSRDQSIADVLNLPRAGAPYVQKRDSIPAREFFEAINATEFSALTTVQLMRLSLIMQTYQGTLNPSGSNLRGILADIFPPGGQTRAALVAMVDRQGSRAEVLFGPGTVIRHEDVAKALRP